MEASLYHATNDNMTAKLRESAPYATNIEPVEPRYLNSAQTARYLGLENSNTLAIWRRRGYGPPFVAIGRRGSNRYLYDMKDLDEWMLAQKLYPQRPHKLHSDQGEGSLRPTLVNAKKPKAKRPRKTGTKPAASDLHKVFRTVSEEPPND